MDEPPTPLHVRVAGDSNAVYIDMPDEENRVIEIADGTWRILTTAPYVFSRTELTGPIAEPIRGGNLKRLWRHVNIAREDEPLLVAVLVDVLIQPNTPKPVTALLAEHGSAKSTTAKRMVELADPAPVPLRSPPRDIRQWIIAAAGSWMVALDNLSSIPGWLSDAICRAATGDGSVDRRLYTDEDLSVIKFRRSVIVNGIDVGGLNGDLTDRLVPIKLRRIETTKSERDLEDEWQAERADILGGLLTLAAKVHHKRPTVEQVSLPRMADFGRVLACIDVVTDSKGMDRYRTRGKYMLTDSARSNSFIARLIDTRYDTKGTTKSASEILLEVLPSQDGWGAKPADWPKKPREVTTLLNKHAPALRAMHWEISNDEGRNKECITKWTITPPPNP